MKTTRQKTKRRILGIRETTGLVFASIVDMFGEGTLRFEQLLPAIVLGLRDARIAEETELTLEVTLKGWTHWVCYSSYDGELLWIQ